MQFKYFRPPEGWNDLEWDAPWGVHKILYRKRVLPADLLDDEDRLIRSNRTIEGGWFDIPPADETVGEHWAEHRARTTWRGSAATSPLELRIANIGRFTHLDPDKRDDLELDALLEDMTGKIIIGAYRNLARARHAKSPEEREEARSRLRKAAIGLGLHWFGRPDEEREQKQRWGEQSLRKIHELLAEARRIFRGRRYRDDGGSAEDEDLERLKRRVIWWLERWAWCGGSPRLDLLEKDYQWVKILRQEESSARSVPLEEARRLLGLERAKRDEY